jgi:hypothetical protein
VIHISKSLIAKLPPGERADIEDALWEKSGGICFLCEEPLQRASESIEADHNVPEDEDGPTEVANLNLAHVECNRAKRNAKTVPVRPYLKLKAYVRKRGPRLKYDGLLEHFGIEPQPVVVDRVGGEAHFELPDGSTERVLVYSESNAAGTQEYCFVSLPRNAIFNDDQVQPRSIRETHVWSIYSDLQSNPLHEPPGCRLVPDGHSNRILMFDGQHKTVATWMMGRERIVSKVYFSLERTRANQLVNSIQSRIPKLPLSPFELAAKMEQEWRDKLDEYESQVGHDEASEAGFFKWLAANERPRGKAAFKEALIQTQLGNPDLRLRQYVRSTGEKGPADALVINEPTLKNKVLGRLINFEPSPLQGEEFAAYRATEAANVAFLLNALTNAVLLPRGEEPELTAAQVVAAKRMLYQSALQYVSDLLLKAFRHVTMQDSLGAARLSDEQRASLESFVDRLSAHPVWTADFGKDERMTAVKNALDKNQDARRSFEAVALDLSYLVVGEESAAFKAYWRSA